MARKPRSFQGGLFYHVMNRASARARIFFHDADYAAFERNPPPPPPHVRPASTFTKIKFPIT